MFQDSSSLHGRLPLLQYRIFLSKQLLIFVPVGHERCDTSFLEKQFQHEDETGLQGFELGAV